jgi:hypothetical protein
VRGLASAPLRKQRYRYVDSKPRYAGVDSFLRSRGIIVDWGNPNDPRARAPSAGSGACMLGTLPEHAVVIEDAIFGVQAGRTGSFGLIIGVARGDDPEILCQNGAEIVVRDLAELSPV